MNAGIRLVITLALVAATPSFAAKPATPMPSAQLSHLIETTMAKMNDITNPKEKFNRTPLTTAQAEFSATAQTAPPEKQPMYQAVLNVVGILLGVVEEHNKAVADLENSLSVHGPADTKDLEISNPRHGWDPAAVARANKAKEDHVNGEAKKAALNKDAFFSKGAITAWAKRFEQLQEIVEQAYTAEVLAEKQLAMLTPPAPLPPPPAPKPASKPPKEKPTKEISASDEHSPVGSWKTVIPGHPWTHRSPTLNEDNTVVSGKYTGTWNWTDQSKGALCIVWKDGLRADLNFSPDGRAMTGTVSKGAKESYIRSTEAAPDASKSPSDASTGAPAIAEIRLKADPTKGLLVQRDKPAHFLRERPAKLEFCRA